MDLIVAAKYVPDIQKVPEEAWDRERGTLKRHLLQMVFNPLDRVALRTALRLRERSAGARVTVVTMGPPVAVRLLREAIAHGADAGVLLTDRALAGSDTLATAYALQLTIRHLVAAGRVSPDFVLVCGMQSPDGDTAQVPAQIASLLDVPLYPYVCDLLDRDGQLAFRCLNPVGFQVVTPRSLPYVITTTRLAEDLPFHVTLEGILRANCSEILTLDAQAIGADPERIGLSGSRTRVVHIYAAPRKTARAEPILAEREDFPERARDLWRELRTAYTQGSGVGHQASGVREEGGGKPDARRPTAEPYYRGDCLALCEVQEGKFTAASLEVASRCAELARDLGVASLALLYGSADEAMAEALGQVGVSTLYAVAATEESASSDADSSSGRHLRMPTPPVDACRGESSSGDADSAVEGAGEGPFLVRERALALAAFLEQFRPQVVILPATLTGRVVAPYVAAQLDCGLTADCSALDIVDFTAFDREAGRPVTYGQVLQQTRPALGGNIMARIVSIYRDRSRHRAQMATARPGALGSGSSLSPSGRGSRFTLTLPSPWKGEGKVAGGRCEIRRVPLPSIPPAASTVELERRPEAREEVDLNDFEAVVCVGMGVRNRETIERLVAPFCEALGAFLGCKVGLGCSRAVVDSGLLPHSHQIGQTGVVIKPRLYVGLGVSGALQHRIGMEGARLVVCLNRDAEAPMHALADFSIVGDIEECISVLQRALKDA